MTKLSPELQNNLAMTRRAFNMTQDELARVINVSRQTVSSMEQGDYNPSATLVLRVAAFFDLPVEQLFALSDAARAALETERCRFLGARSKTKAPSQ